MTYPDPTVASFIEERFIPVQLDVDREADALDPYAVGWTPTLVVLDAEDRQHRRIIGVHEPKELIAELAIGSLEEAMAREGWTDALERSQLALKLTKGDREREAEARYLAGAAQYKASGDVGKLTRAWASLLEELPGTLFARKIEYTRER